jgi:hypothetical protein
MASMTTVITLMRTGSQEYRRGAVASDRPFILFASLLCRMNHDQDVH